MAYKSGAIKEFERHPRLGFVSRDGFSDEVDRLAAWDSRHHPEDRGLQHGWSWPWPSVMELRPRSTFSIIDGAPGGTGMSPWPMMNEWGIPTFYLQALVYCEFATSFIPSGEEGAGYRYGRRLFH